MTVANRRVELDDSVTFAGFHWNNRRETYADCGSAMIGEAVHVPRPTPGSPDI
jgi:hypothetical protein